jgi:hypothetical protein
MNETPGIREEIHLLQSYRRALKVVERGAALSTPQLEEQGDVAERAVARLRNELIDKLREVAGSAEEPRWREALDRVNTILSLVVSVEYPVARIQREALEEAHGVLQGLSAFFLPRARAWTEGA